MKTKDVPFRKVNLGPTEALVEKRTDGAILIRRADPLLPPPGRLTDRFLLWANERPDRILLGELDSANEWNRITWGEALTSVRSLAQALIERGLSESRPVVILSENSIEHALLSIACMLAGIPAVPVSPSYSLLSKDFLKLRHVFGIAAPGLVFAQNGDRYRAAIEAVVPRGAEVVVVDSPYERATGITGFSALLATRATTDVDTAHARVTSETLAKVLFTSGSTGQPKGVPLTQRMICTNQQALLQTYPLYGEGKLVLVDWMPWHHTFGGNQNLGCVIFNGGTFYIDHGRPLPGLIEATVRILRKVSPTKYIGVPKGVEMLLPFLQRDRELAQNMFQEIQCTMFGGAPMAPHILDALEEVEVSSVGERIVNVNGVGSTDAGPSALMANWHVGNRPIVGLPVSGMEAKIVPNGNKLELRLRGDAVLKGYWKDPVKTREAFDEEGFFKIGDAVAWVDPANFAKGMIYNGRVVEDFKLSSGTWVNVGALRDGLIARAAPIVRDVVITGHGSDHVGAMIFLNIDACRSAIDEMPPSATEADVVADPRVRQTIKKALDALGSEAGSSGRIDRAVIEIEQPSLDNGEQTDKGSVSQRSVLDRRTRVVEELSQARPSERTIVRGL